MLLLPQPNHRLSRCAVLVCALALAGVAGDTVSRGASTKERAKVMAVRFWSFDDLTRISIETSGEFELKYDRLDHPDRLFFDLVGAQSEVGPKGFRTIAVRDKIVRQIRVAETQHGVTRVVLDLNRYARFTTSRIENPDRLVIEVRDSDAAPVFGGPEPKITPGGRRSFIPPSPVTAGFRTTPLIEAPPDVRAAPPFASSVLMARLTVPPRPYGHVAKSQAAPRVAYIEPEPLPIERAPARTAKLLEPQGAPEPARRNAGAQSMTRVLGLKVSRVVIDAGHGGHDTGTIGAGGLLEKDVVLDVALRLGKLIEQRMGADVVYTRSDDTFIPLQDRTRIANDSHADLFLSIHANSSPDRSASGVETYYLNFTSSQSALDVAARENAGSDKSVFELKDLLQKIALQDKIDESRQFAASVQSSLYAASARLDPKSKDRGVRKAPFVVLIGASMPSVLAEISFISNPRDASALKRGEGRQRIAEALYKGVSKYSGTLSHFDVARRGTD